jgi:predicted PurR-regulated permease PerM
LDFALTIKGTLVIGIIQGTLSGLAFWAAGIDGAAFWGTVMTVLSIRLRTIPDRVGDLRRNV